MEVVAAPVEVSARLAPLLDRGAYLCVAHGLDVVDTGRVVYAGVGRVQEQPCVDHGGCRQHGRDE